MLIHNVNYDKDDMADILSAAFSGIGYWAILLNDRKDYQEIRDKVVAEHKAQPGPQVPLSLEDVCYAALEAGVSLHFEDAESGDEYELTDEALAKGIEQAIDEGDWSGDMDDLDAEIGDIIIQYAIFDEIMFA